MTNEDDSSGFKEDEESFETPSMRATIETIQLGGGISPTRILIEISHENGSTRDATGSIELTNLCRHDAGGAYDEETRELNYNELERDLQLRVDALINWTRFDNSTSESEGESDADVLKRYHGQKGE
ncbi:hypothetical protein [Halorubrum trueperi]|uniref:Uncharacterized protein n=1 Tax=Halorubrum trueperi TaxID=2004704 RepID=A0ABD5USX9_9EURY